MSWSDSDKTVIPITLLIILVITIIATMLLKNKSKAIKLIPFMLISVILIVLEIIKQLRSINDYSFSLVPLQFCSMFMLWFLIASFGKKRIGEIGFSISFVTIILFLIGYLTYPDTIIGGATKDVFGNFRNFHTYIYHNLVILFLFLSVSLKMIKFNLKDVKWISVMLGVYLMVATIMANMLNVNFYNLLYGTYKPLENIRQTASYFLYLLVLYATTIGGGSLIYLAGYYSSKLFNNKIRYKILSNNK